MVTGDSAQCGHYVGRACGMVAEAADLLLADVDPSGDVCWAPMREYSQDDKLLHALSTAQVTPLSYLFSSSGSHVSQSMQSLCKYLSLMAQLHVPEPGLLVLLS